MKKKKRLLNNDQYFHILYSLLYNNLYIVYYYNYFIFVLTYTILYYYNYNFVYIYYHTSFLFLIDLVLTKKATKEIKTTEHPQINISAILSDGIQLIFKQAFSFRTSEV